MVSVNELRIGNWIQTSVPQKVTIQIMEFLCNNMIPDKSVIKSIPVSPYILEKAGYQKNQLTGIWINEKSIDDHFKSMLIELDEELFLFTIYDNGKEVSKIPLKTVHQLQNLYFELTGEELHIQL
jgi:hypothetical protein